MLQASAYANSQLKMPLSRLSSSLLCLVTCLERHAERKLRHRGVTCCIGAMRLRLPQCVLEPDMRCVSMLCVAVYHFASRAP
jgi:hypothetical protein